jgi:hypothetical protein
MVPLTATFTYALAVFSFGLDGDLAGRQSMSRPQFTPAGDDGGARVVADGLWFHSHGDFVAGD